MDRWGAEEFILSVVEVVLNAVEVVLNVSEVILNVDEVILDLMKVWQQKLELALMWMSDSDIV